MYNPNNPNKLFEDLYDLLHKYLIDANELIYKSSFFVFKDIFI